MASQVLYVAPAIAAVGLVYSSVGLGGGTMYLALLALSGTPVLAIPQIVLILNTVTASAAWWNFTRQGYFSWRLTLPFVLTSIPMAFLAGRWAVGESFLAILMAAFLLAAAVRTLISGGEKKTRAFSSNIWLIGPSLGFVLGAISGLIGIGGGIFLAPVLLQLGWAGQKEVAGTTSAFVALNSAIGVLSHTSRAWINPELVLFLVVPAILGGFVGSHLGSTRIQATLLRKVLAGVLVSASILLIVRLL